MPDRRPGATATLPSVYEWANQVFSRTSGAPLCDGNRVVLLKDAAENYPAWLRAIDVAQRTIHFEMYIIHEDAQGTLFAEALLRKAAEGVQVRLLYDWMGGFGKTSRAFWNRLRAGSIDVRCYNPPRFDRPLGWLSRDHRKTIVIDSDVAFVTGLCVGQAWVGDPARHLDPWRDTGIEVRGPAVADIEAAFAEAWAAAGAPLPANALGQPPPPLGDVPLRVVATVPNTAGLFRVDQLVAAMARNRLWLTDAYYGGTAPYVDALRAAARDGVDVRLLVPGASDIPLVRLFSRAGYRPLLEAGIRVYEWNGSMIHAKTAVADGRWARVGSTNLNVASWLGNRELDVIVEHEPFAREMEDMFLRDLRKCDGGCAAAQPCPGARCACGPCSPSEWCEQRGPRCGGSGARRQHGRGRHHQHARARSGRIEHRADRGHDSRPRRRSGFQVPAHDRISAWRIRGLGRRGNSLSRRSVGSSRKASMKVEVYRRLVYSCDKDKEDLVRDRSHEDKS